MGIIPRTMMPFMPKRTTVSVSDWSIRRPTDGARTNINRSSAPMMMGAKPTLLTSVRILFMAVHLLFFELDFSVHKQTKFFGRCGWRQDTGDAAFVDDGDAVTNGPEFFKLRRDHDDRCTVLAVVGAKCFQHE